MEELLKEMKKRSIGNVMPISVILLIAAIVMLIINGAASLQLFAYLTGGKNLDDIPKSEMYNVIANSEINVVYDCFAEYETGEGDIYDYYVIPYGEEKFIAVCVGESKITQMESICDDT